MLWDVLFLKPAIYSSLFSNGHYTDSNVFLVGINLNFVQEFMAEILKNPGNLKNSAGSTIYLY